MAPPLLPEQARWFTATLRSKGESADDAWRTWAARLVKRDQVNTELLRSIWEAVVGFDETLARFVEAPVPVPPGTVSVSGSGKETLKTFNVSTAAALMAAAAGVSVVKGTSASVSAVSGSDDVLAEIGVPVLHDPALVTESVLRTGIAFVSYGSFCPRYAARYDGCFRALNPMSFLMPAASLLVSADAFLHGLAHDDVGTAAHGIHAARPDIARGRVGTTLLGPGLRVDELAPVSRTTYADLHWGHVKVTQRVLGGSIGPWRRAVAHRASHRANAAVLLESLRPDATTVLADFVDVNAAAVVSLARPEITEDDALTLVHEARRRGGPARILHSLRETTPRKESR
ncbi:hypothetical protein [Streptomyces bauhiniae]|uniref:hypothetical protein n=1 Tax=Streptomyces bauhiniae TaxID=2340725 RepID=UPI00142F0722|nr:hypothetical protein [Streptomyces bauhiniae]